MLGTAYSLTGNVLAETGDPAGARAAYGEALAIRQEASRRQPRATETSSEIWQRPTTASASYCPGRATRQVRLAPTARRWRSSRSLPTPTPASPSSS